MAGGELERRWAAREEPGLGGHKSEVLVAHLGVEKLDARQRFATENELGTARLGESTLRPILVRRSPPANAGSS